MGRAFQAQHSEGQKGPGVFVDGELFGVSKARCAGERGEHEGQGHPLLKGDC